MKLFLLLAAALALISAQKLPAGVAISADTELVKNVKNYIMPMILKVVNEVKVPRIDFSGGHVDNLNIDLFLQSNESLTLKFSKAVNGGILRTQNINGMVSGSVKYKVLFISINADVKVTFDDGAISFVTELPVHSQHINDKVLPRVDVRNFDLTFDTNKIHISLSGSILADILDKIVWIFKSLIMGEISKVIESQVPSVVQDQLNSMIIKTNGIAPMGYKDLGFDFQVTADPIFTDDAVELYLNATIFDMVAGYKTPGTPVSQVEIDLTNRNQIMVDATQYSVDSLLSVVQDKDMFSLLITPDSFDGMLKSYLITTYLDGFLPGMVAKYGKDTPVSVNFKSFAAPNSFFNPSEVGAKLHATIEFIVNQEVAVSLTLTDADALVTPSLSNFVLKVQIIKFAIKAIQLNQSTIGAVDPDELRVFLNVLFRTAVPIVNDKVLSKGFTLPRQFFGIVEIQEAEFKAMQDFIQIGFVPHFI